MKSKVFGILPTVALSLCAYSSYAFADGMPDQQNQWQQPSIPNWSAHQKSSGPMVMGELLIWRAEEDTLEYAIAITEPRDVLTTVGTGSFKTPTRSWDVGSRVAIGYLFNYDHWAVDLEWTRFHPSKATSKVSTSDTLFEPIYMVLANGQSRSASPTGTPGAQSASAKWKLAYDTVDLSVGRQFSVTKYLDLCPKLGIESAWIQQGYTVNYGGIAYGSGLANIKYVNRNNFWGIGLRGALNSMWRFGPHFGLYGNAGGALLWSMFKFKSNGTRNYAGTPNDSPLTKIRRSFHTVAGALDLELGLACNFKFHRDKWEFLFNFGWQELIWFNQNQLMTMNSVVNANTYTSHGDLSLSGFVLGIQLKL